MGRLNFDLQQQLTFYGAYHANPWNQVRGLGVCVWVSVWAEAIPSPRGKKRHRRDTTDAPRRQNPPLAHAHS